MSDPYLVARSLARPGPAPVDLNVEEEPGYESHFIPPAAAQSPPDQKAKVEKRGSRSQIAMAVAEDAGDDEIKCQKRHVYKLPNVQEMKVNSSRLKVISFSTKTHD